MVDAGRSVALRLAAAGEADAIADVYLASRRTFLSFAPLTHDAADVLYELC